jgi:hypothetical protein
MSLKLLNNVLKTQIPNILVFFHIKSKIQHQNIFKQIYNTANLNIKRSILLLNYFIYLFILS